MLLKLFKETGQFFPSSALSWFSQRKAGNGASYVLLQEGNHRNLPGDKLAGLRGTNVVASQICISFCMGRSFLCRKARPTPQAQPSKRCTIVFPSMHVAVEIPSLSQEGQTWDLVLLHPATSGISLCPSADPKAQIPVGLG